MQVNSIQQNKQVNFMAILNPKLLAGAKRCAKTEMQKSFLAKRIKEIEQYGDKNTIISSDSLCYRTTGATIGIHADNPCMPKCKSSPRDLDTCLYVPYRCAFGEYQPRANEYDIVTMITPDRVYECEKLFFKDTIHYNKLDPQKELERCKSIVAPDTYKAFQEAAVEGFLNKSY